MNHVNEPLILCAREQVPRNTVCNTYTSTQNWPGVGGNQFQGGHLELGLRAYLPTGLLRSGWARGIQGR